MLAKTLFPERFNLDFAKRVHREIFKLIDAPANKVAIAAPLEWGKSSGICILRHRLPVPAIVASVYEGIKFVIHEYKVTDFQLQQGENMTEMSSVKNIDRKQVSRVISCSSLRKQSGF